MNKKRIMNLSVAWLVAFALIFAVTMLFQVQGVSSQVLGESEEEVGSTLLTRGVQNESVEGLPSISLTKTVGTDPNTCASATTITVTQGTDVTYCYNVANTGGSLLTVHELSDTILGTILSGFPYSLTPGASFYVTQTANITTDTVNVATWTACNIDGPPTLTCFDGAAFDVVSDTATAQVVVTQPPPTDVSLSGFGGSSNTLALPVMFGLMALLILVPFFITRRIQTRE